MAIIGILLAAGSGSRFGGDKLLALLPEGTPIGIASWKNLALALPERIAIARVGDIALRGILADEGAQVVTCNDAHIGMSRSLIAGLLATDAADGWVVALGDMPYIKPSTIKNVSDAIESGALIAQPTHQGKRGHPVGLSARLRAELLEVKGDEGAREIVKRHASDCVLIECDDPGILRDIDSREDID